MKKVFITILATLVTLFFLAETGLLAPFGIKQITLFSRPKPEKDNVDEKNEITTDTVTGVNYRFKAEKENFYVYTGGEWKKLFMCGVNIGATEPALFPGDLTISYDSYYRWFGYISEMNCNCIRVYTTMSPQFYLALGDYNKQAENPLYLYQGIWVNEEDIEVLCDVYAENQKIMTEFKQDAISPARR